MTPLIEAVVLGRLLLLFIVVPLVELTLLLILAQYTSPLFTLGVVIVTGVAGSLLARSQGFKTFRRIQQEISAGQLPTDALLDAAMIFFAGGLLLTPGVLTDALGISLLIPVCRRYYRRRLVRWFKARFRVDAFGPGGGPSQPGTSPPGRTEVIDSYVVRSSDDRTPPEERGESTS